MKDKNKNDIKKSIPVSVVIADIRNKLNEIVNHSLLPPSIIELILKEAWQTVAIKAQAQLVSDFNEYNKEQDEKDNGIGDKEENNGL